MKVKLSNTKKVSIRKMPLQKGWVAEDPDRV